MTRPSDHLLDPERYPFAVEIATRFADVPALKHINNVAMAGLFEEGRVRFVHHVFDGKTDWTEATYLASAHIEYLDKGHYPQPIVMRMGIERIGGASLTLAQLVLQDGIPKAFCRAVDVHSPDGRPVTIPDFYRMKFNSFLLGRT